MGIDTVESWTLDDLARRAAAPLEDVLTGLYNLVRQDVSLDRFAIINPGCSEHDLDAAEARIGHGLHPLHRLILRLSNGGTLPFVASVSTIAAAVPREQEWRIGGPFLTPEEQAAQQVLVVRMLHPVTPWILGQFPPGLDSKDLSPSLTNLIVFADGFGDQCWGYVKEEPEQIDCYLQVPGGGRYSEASSFEEFLRNQTLYRRLRTPEFVQLVRADIAGS